MEKRLAVALGVIVATTIVLAAGTTRKGGNPKTFPEAEDAKTFPGAEDPKVVLADVSWAHWYPDLESLMDGHSTVIVGEVQSSDMVDQREGFTHHMVKLLEVVKGDMKVGDIITISQSGGIYTSLNGETTSCEFEDDPLMKVGEISLLFLNGPTVQEIVSDKEVYLGTSPQTRFIVENGKVFWMGDVFTDRRITGIADEVMWMNGKPLETVLARLEEIGKPCPPLGP